MKKVKLFGAFEKVEPQEDGTLIVAGIASSEAVDGAGEIVRADAMKAALPAYMEFANIREMHQPIAAGTALKCEVGEDGKTYLEAKIVDPTTVLKIQEGVLKGFSIGGKVTSRDELNKTVITGLRLSEISVVDRPCNPEAKFSMGKVEGDDEPTLGDLRKGMYEVQEFASLLERMGFMALWLSQEAEWEGDSSPIPAQLATWMAEGKEIFLAMAKEEIEELLALLPAPPSAEVLAMAEKLAKGEAPEDLAKKGARFSKVVKAALADVHKAVRDCDSKLAGLGYEAAEEEEEEDEGAEKLAKLASENGEALAKIEQLQADLTKAQEELVDLRKQPAEPKGVKKVVVSKGEDTASENPVNDLSKVAVQLQGLSPEALAAQLITRIHGGR